MRNKQLIHFFLYPKYFSSLAIPYKGKYFIRIRLYQKKLLNDKITYAYPILKQFTENKSIKQTHPPKIHINPTNTYYDTQTFYLFYADEKISLNSCCTFILEYDQIRQFKTFIEFQLIKKSDKMAGDQRDGCMTSRKNQKSGEDQIICKEIYLVNSYKQLDVFERVYFEHQEFYCALDMYLSTVSFGNFMRPNKVQLVQFSQLMKQNSKDKLQIKKQRYLPKLDELVVQLNRQINEYTQLRKVLLKYQQTLKLKKSFLYQSKIPPLLSVQAFKDLSYLKYSYKDYSSNGSKNKQKDTIYEIYQSKFIVNDNIRYLFQKLPKYIKDITPPVFKSYINQSLKKKYDLKKKYLIKKMALNCNNLNDASTNINLHVLMNNSSVNLQKSKDMMISPRKSFAPSNEILPVDNVRNSSTFKQNRKVEKQQFVHVRRDQFLKASQIINTKDYNFPMMLIQKSSEEFIEQDKKNIIQELKKPAKSDSNISSMYDQMSLVILIHGYQGSHHDLRKLKNYLEHLNPNLKVLPINSIQKNVDDSIEVLGQKIADEIDFYVKNSFQPIKKITFIGFSLGGVLARACLKHLKQHKQKMGMLITLASPHLGVSESENTLVNLGVWYLSKIDKAKNIKQLNFYSVTQKDSFLMKLSLGDQISWFQKVVIVSSSEDQFVPHYSARIIGNTKNEPINQMAKNILSRIRKFQRIEVWFDVEKKTSIDKLIGRKSHIEFIENFSFLQMLCKLYQQEI